ncbi:MAG: universal stress protein [Spirochaetia bacterium]|jgi:nucleotide-binding universal stress UspA family protein
MFKHLLVPLDGSRMAESALPIAARLSGQAAATLTLVHVIEKNAPKAIHSERHLVTAEEASAYLAEVAQRPVLKGLRVRTHVHEAEVRDVALSITQHSEELAPDLVVMSTHGRAGARRLIFGAIAQQVIGLGVTPVLLVQQPAELGTWRTILAPIDGNPAHEKGLPIAAELAAAFSCLLHLLMVTPHMGELTGSQGAASILLPGATRIKLEIDSDAAREYLAARAGELRSTGIETGTEASRGDPARAIVRTARKLSADIIVMGTHGRAGTDAFWQGSVAARVIARARAPLLLVPLRA